MTDMAEKQAQHQPAQPLVREYYQSAQPVIVDDYAPVADNEVF